jgi:hypothetical protein
MAAGVIPSMREACPKDAGRTAPSFSLSSLERPWTVIVIDRVGQFDLFQVPELVDLLKLTLDVAFVFDFNLHLTGHRRLQGRLCRGQRGRRCRSPAQRV